MPAKSRSWCFTINNPTDDDVSKVKAVQCRYIVAGNEVGASGTPHIQGLVVYETQRYLAGVSKDFPRAHLEQTRGTFEQASQYCKKDADILIEKGTPPRQGARTDILKVKDHIEKGDSILTLMEEGVLKNLQHLKMAQEIMKLVEEPRNWKPEVHWYYGTAGSGKTKAAYEWLPDAYTPVSLKWWEGYDGHPDVIIDDLRLKNIDDFQLLLKIMDRYQHRVETKGSSRQLRARRIVITAPFHPTKMFDKDEDAAQIVRRCDVIKKFSKSGVQDKKAPAPTPDGPSATPPPPESSSPVRTVCEGSSSRGTPSVSLSDANGPPRHSGRTSRWRELTQARTEAAVNYRADFAPHYDPLD